jgi:2-polyprenyl-6-methoxyphenol hydroxylase-like FAD-dependent oxidoreductase
MKRVLISGPGIAGLTLTCCLVDFGWQVEVIEMADGERPCDNWRDLRLHHVLPQIPNQNQ